MNIQTNTQVKNDKLINIYKDFLIHLLQIAGTEHMTESRKLEEIVMNCGDMIEDLHH